VAGVIAVWRTRIAGQSSITRAVAGGIASGLTLRFAVNLADSNTFAGLSPLELQPLAQSYAIDWQPQRLASMTLTWFDRVT
jgi:hypothetical protein